jgi:hypothetical protein
MLNINVILQLKNLKLMNRLMIKLLIAIISIIAISCDKITVDSPKDLDYFMKFYGNYYNDNLYDIGITQAEEIVLAGYRNLDEDQEEAWIIKTGTDGMVEWEKTYSGLNSQRGYGLLVDGNIYFTRYTTEDGSPQGFLYVYNMDGTVVDSSDFSIDGDEVEDIDFMKKSINRRFVAQVKKDGKHELHIYEISASNQAVLVSKNQLHSVVDERMYYYEQENGDFYITGSIQEVDNETYSDIMVSHIVDDNIVWSYSYGEPGVTEKSSGITLLNDLLYVAATEILDPVANEGQVYLMKMNTIGLEAEIYDINLTGNNTSYDMIVNGDNEFAFIGERIDDQNSKVFMARTSLTGDVLSENEYGYKGLNRGRFIVNLPGENKGFIIAGDITTSANAKDILVIKANETGEWIY